MGLRLWFRNFVLVVPLGLVDGDLLEHGVDRGDTHGYGRNSVDVPCTDEMLIVKSIIEHNVPGNE